MADLIYLACPYSHNDLAVRESRFDAANRVAAALMRRGEFVFSPLSHSHPMVDYGLPGGWEFWQRFDRVMLGCCDEVRVLRLPGWEESVGVRAEIAYAKAQGMPVVFLDADGKS